MPKDSLALVSFYNSTNGNNWTDKTNWLVGPVSTWHGIEVSVDRVIGIQMSNNNLSSTLPADIGNLDQLTYLKLNFNNIGGAIPSSLYSLTKLEILLILDSPITGTISENIGNLTKLKFLYFYNNQLTGTVPLNISKLTALTSILLAQNQFIGDITTIINNLSFAKSLQKIDIYYTNISGVLPTSIGSFSNLTELYLDGNKLTGSLPASLGNLLNLTHLIFSNNKFTGSLPELGNLNKMEKFFGGNNLLSGGIPDSYTNFTGIITFDIGLNQLNGSIPTFIGNWVNLTGLFLNDNSFSGYVPHTIGNCTLLNALFLQNNHLIGSFPSSIENNVTLNNFQIQNNQFTSIPDFSKNVNRANLNVYTGNNKLDFGSMEANFISPGVPAISVFSYSPQDSIPIIPNYSALTISVLCPGSNNRYQWQKNGVNIPGATQSTLAFGKTDTVIVNYNCLVTNTKVTRITLSSKKINVYPSIPPTGQKDNLGFMKVISQEINTINGSALIRIRLYADTNLTWKSPLTITKPNNWTISKITYPSKTTLLKKDSVDFTVIINYPTANIPFFPKDISFSINTLLGTVNQNQLAKGKVFFTPYNTVEIWNVSDFFGLNRIWIQPGSVKDTLRRFITKSSIPASNILPTDNISEDWQDDFQWKSFPGLAYMIKMRGVNPEIIARQNIDDGPDSSYTSTGLRTQGLCILCNVFTRTFTGTVKGRLVSNIINDLGNPITIPLSGVLVKLKEMDVVFNEEFGETTTDMFGYFTINYSKKQSKFEGKEIELFLKIKSKNREYNINVEGSGIGFLTGTYENAYGLGSHGESDFNITPQNGGVITLSEGHWNVLNWGYKSFAYFESQGLPLIRELAILPYRNTSMFLPDGLGFKLSFLRPTIRLEVTDTQHENTIYHEFGHFAMWSLQKTTYALTTKFRHTWQAESNPILAWTEGWGDAMQMILDANYRDENGNGTFDSDEEYGYDQLDCSSGTCIPRTTPEYEKSINWGTTNINNGINSEYYMACAIYDLWDGAGKGLPVLLPGGASDRHGYNDLSSSGATYPNGWSVPDNVELTFKQIATPLTLFDFSTGQPKSVLITNISDYVRRLLSTITDCNVKNQIANAFNQNKVAENITLLNSNPNINSGINTDDIVYTYYDGLFFFQTKHFMNPYFGLKGQNNFNYNLQNGASINDNLALIGTNASGNAFHISMGNNSTVGTCGNVNIVIQNAALFIGNGSLNVRTEIRTGSVLQVKTGGVLNIADNTTLVIDCGATFIFENGGAINLNGSNAKLIIDGKLVLTGVSKLPVAYSTTSLSLSGPASAVTSGSVYTVSGKAGDTFTWTVPGGWHINGQQVSTLSAGVAVTITPPISACGGNFYTISAKANNGCYAGSVTSIQIKSGTVPKAPNPINVTADCNEYRFSTSGADGASQFEWHYYLLPNAGTEVITTGGSTIKLKLYTGNWRIGVKAINICGLSDIIYTDVAVNCSQHLAAVFPNPAARQLNIELMNNNTVIDTLKSKTGTNIEQEFSIILYNKFQQTVKTGNSKNEKLQLDLSGLSDGMYYLHISQNGEVIERQHIIIQK